jgi:hypothetical protein
MASDIRMAFADWDFFQNKIKYFMQKAALAVLGESYGDVDEPTEAEHTLRITYAKSILAGTASVEQYSCAVATNSTIATSLDSGTLPSDNDLEFTVNSMFNDFAGVD